MMLFDGEGRYQCLFIFGNSWGLHIPWIPAWKSCGDAYALICAVKQVTVDELVGIRNYTKFLASGRLAGMLGGPWEGQEKR